MKRNLFYFIILMAFVAMPLTSCEKGQKGEEQGQHDPSSDEDQIEITGYDGLFGGMQAVYLMKRKNIKAGENAHMAFGPALCIGMIIALFWGNELISLYFGWFY